MTSIKNTKFRCQTVHHDSVNFSTAHQKYSFSKDRRFPKISAAITPTDFTEKLNSTFNRRSPSFGIGDRFMEPRTSCKRVQLLCLEQTPSPG